MSAGLAVLLGCMACGASGTKGPAESGTAPAASGAAARIVNAIILANGCDAMGRNSAKMAESAMNLLVEACTSVPGGTAQFQATLEPGGRIEIAGTAGQPDVVPICILKHALLHKVPLQKPCTLDVKIEEMTIPVATRAGDAAAP
jgi:hypothetical protein